MDNKTEQEIYKEMTQGVNRELEAYLSTIFSMVPPLPENQELFYKALGRAQKEYETLKEQGKDSLDSTEQVMENIPDYPEVLQAIPLEEGRIWTKKEAEEHQRKRKILLRVSIVLLALGLVALLAGFLFFTETPRWPWVVLTVVLWVIPATLLYTQREMYAQEIPDKSDQGKK